MNLFIAGAGGVLGRGDSRSTPIHVPELAALMLDGIDRRENVVVECGGPEDLTWREICALCFEVQARPVRIRSVPVWFCRLTLALLRPFSYRYHAMGRLLLFMSMRDTCTPHLGAVRLRDYLARPAAD